MNKTKNREVTEEIIGRAPSAKVARRTLEEMAVTGNYTAKELRDKFVIYSRRLTDLVEEITVRRINLRSYHIIKRTIPIPPGIL